MLCARDGERDVAALYFDTALTPEGWKNGVRITIDDGAIASVTSGSDARARRRAPRDRPARHAKPAQPRLSARHGGARGNPRLLRRHVLDLAGGDVPLRADHVAGGCRGGRGAALRRDAGSRLHARSANSTICITTATARPYANIAELAERIAAAAATSGIGLTLLPVFYAHSNFGGAPPTEGQRRFICDLGTFARLLEASRKATMGLPGAKLGVAPHSLRAVTTEELARRGHDGRRCADPHAHRRAGEGGRGFASPGRARGRSNGCSARSTSTGAGA